MVQPTGLHPEAPRFLAAEPQLFVTDIGRSCAFFEDLGFSVAFLHGEPPFYAQVRRGEGALNLRRVVCPPFEAAFREREPDALSATLLVDDAAGLFQDYVLEGTIASHQELRTEPWGARTFIVADPDGNLIAFADGGDPSTAP